GNESKPAVAMAASALALTSVPGSRRGARSARPRPLPSASSSLPSSASSRALAGASGMRNSVWASAALLVRSGEGLDVGRRGAFGPHFDVEFHALGRLELLHAGRADRGLVH